MRRSYVLVGSLVVVLAFVLFAHPRGANRPENAAGAGTGQAAGGPVPTAPASDSSTAPATSPAPDDSPGSNAPSNAAGHGGDSFTPHKLAAGERPPQFVVLSFDGAGWHKKWDYWNAIGRKVPFRFTAFLTGLYLLDEQHRDAYRGPGHTPGHTSLGTWNDAQEVQQEVRDLNAAWARGDEIGTHFNGHFCSDNPPGANDWSTADWNNELDQFFRFFRNYRKIDRLPDAPRLMVPADSITSERTPCLEGHPSELFPALKAHGFTADSSVTRRGLYWPTRDDHGIWQMGMSTFPLHGTDHFVTTMDYNFWYTQAGAHEQSPTQASADGRQVEQTYLDMYHAAYSGNRAPLILGNHFNDWNHNAYTTALAHFVVQVCGRPDTYCVPFRDLERWMQVQSPATLSRLQSLPPELSAPAGSH